MFRTLTLVIGLYLISNVAFAQYPYLSEQEEQNLSSSYVKDKELSLKQDKKDKQTTLDSNNQSTKVKKVIKKKPLYEKGTPVRKTRSQRRAERRAKKQMSK